jgi:hypothetical protein
MSRQKRDSVNQASASAVSFKYGHPSGEKGVKNENVFELIQSIKSILIMSEFFRLAIEHVNGSGIEAGRKRLFGSFWGFGQKEHKQSVIARSQMKLNNYIKYIFNH